MKRAPHWVCVIVRRLEIAKYRFHWEHGTCKDRPARRHRMSGEVQFVIWLKGHVLHGRYGGENYTYTEDYWVAFDSSWWPLFQPKSK